MNKLFLITTIPDSLYFFKGQISFLKNDFDISLLSSPSPKLDLICGNENVKAYPISMERDINLPKDCVSLTKLIKLFSREKPYILHCNTPKASLLALVAGYLTRVPHRIYYVHGLRYQGARGIKRKILIFMEKISSFCATDIIAVSNGVRTTMEEEITTKKIEVIGFGSVNGLDMNSFDRSNYNREELRRELGISDSDFVYGFVGRLVGDKGINELVAAFKHISSSQKNVKLILIGNYENKLDPLKDETLIEINENSNILYLGFQKDVRPYMSILDIFVFPSYREGFGVSLMEANAMEVPAIASDIIGCNEIIEDGVNGFLIEPRNLESLIEKMEYCLVNKVMTKAMSLKSREMMKNKFSQHIVWQNSLEMYKKISNV